MANVAMAPTATGENAVGISNPSDILAMNSQPLAFSDEPPPAPPSPFELDEVIPERVSYQLSMANASQGLHFLQIHLPPEHDAESDPNPVTVSWEPTDPDGDGLDGSIDNCPSAFNPDQTDFDADGGGDSCDNDVDGDNVANECDICPQTTVGSVVDPTNGCSIAQLCPCAGPLDSGLSWKNHGAYVSCVAKTSNAFVRAGLIFGKEKDELVSEAGQSSCGSKN